MTSRAADGPSHAALPSLEGVRRLGLLGGTFDPIHAGHIALGRYAADSLELDRVWYIPSAQPPHKTKMPVTPAELRREMTAAAVEPFSPRFVAVDVELARPGFSYTVDTLAEIRTAAPTETEFYWIIGLDNVVEIPGWYRPRELCRLATIVAGGRPGAVLPEDTPPWLAHRLVVLDGPSVEWSSTRVRAEIARGVLDERALPEAVRRVIVRERLYGLPGPAKP